MTAAPDGRRVIQTFTLPYPVKFKPFKYSPGDYVVALSVRGMKRSLFHGELLTRYSTSCGLNYYDAELKGAGIYKLQSELLEEEIVLVCEDK